nr:hypothetical protein [Tanacetum cinerariifolium]
MCLYIDAEEHELGDLDEPANYKPALLDQESVKWLNAMNVEMQSMKENEEKLKLSKSQGASTPAEIKHMQNIPNASAVGSIMYAVRCTRPDVTFAQNTVYVFVLNDGAVDWKSANQSIFATSSTEAEYIAAFDASKEAVWVRKFIFGLSVVPII